MFLSRKLLVLLLLGLAGVWYCRWEIDPPYVTTEIFQQVFLTDEGLYLKPAISLVKTGNQSTPRDINLVVNTTPVHIGLAAALMQVFGLHWTVARWLSFFMSIVGLISFWSLCRLYLPVSLTWVATLAVASNFMFFHSAHMATADPTALGFSMLAAWTWAANRKSALGLLAALGIAIVAAWAKPTYAPLLAAIGLVELIAATFAWRGGDRKSAMQRIAALAVAALIQASLLTHQYLTISHTVSHTHPGVGGFRTSFGTGIRQLLDSFAFSMPILPAAIAMILACLLGLLWSSSERRREILRDPAVQMFAFWIFVNTLIVGLITLHPARYFYATIFAWTFLAFRVAAWDGSAYSLRYAVAILAASLSAQIPLYNFWLSQQPAQTYISISRDIARRVTATHPQGAKLLGHGLSNWIVLFDPRIHSLDYGYRGMDAVDPLASRFDYWRPEYLLVNEDDIWSNSDAIRNLAEKSSAFWGNIELVAEYKLLFRNVFPNSPTTKPNLKLYRVHYQKKSDAAVQGSAGIPPIY